jgi:hypothetical protein
VNEPVSLSVGPLSVEFFASGDRIAHRVVFSRDGAEVARFESIEGDAVAAWPPSPPLAECHIQPSAAGPAIVLLVGRAGVGHWSSSVAATEMPRRIEFDIACRFAGAPPQLGSCYRLRSNCLPVCNPQVLELAGCRIEAAAGADAAARLTLLPQTQNSGEWTLRIEPACVSPGPETRTARWRYAWSG